MEGPLSWVTRETQKQNHREPWPPPAGMAKLKRPWGQVLEKMWGADGALVPAWLF